MLGSSSTSSTLGMLMLGLTRDRRGQLDDKARVAALDALDRNRPAVLADDAEAQAQPEARPARRPPGREERVEDLVDVFPPDADPVVEELDARPRAARALDGARRHAERLAPRALRAQRVVRVADHVDD